MEEELKETDVFICACHSMEHQMKFWWDPEMGIFVETHLASSLKWYQKIIPAIKYIFGYKSKYGNWDEMVFKYEDIIKLKTFIEGINSDPMKN